MAEIEAKFDTRGDAAARMAAMMGTDQPSVFELVDRSKYATEDAYLDALVKTEMERSSPEYQEARRRLKRQYMEMQEQQQTAARAAKQREIRAAVELSGYDQREIDQQAGEKARMDLAAGRIGASDLGATIEQYAKKLGDKKKDELAINQLMNMIFRGQI